MSWLTFMREVIRENKTTGAIAPSSRELAEEVTRMAGLRGSKVIVEYGAGEGVFTRQIMKEKDPDAYFISMEINPHLAAVAQKRCPKAVIINDSAENAVVHLRQAGFEHCDAIVSGLPWTRFNAALQDRILEAAYDVLAPGGRFVTFAYAMSPLVPSGRRFFTGKLPSRFQNVRRIGPVWKNVPPCFVYLCTKMP